MTEKKKFAKEATFVPQEDTFIPQFVELEIIDADGYSAFVKIQDWRMRVCFEDKLINPMNYIRKSLKIEYLGDIKNAHSLQLLPIKL